MEHAEELADVLKRMEMLAHVNLIPVNYVPERNYIRTPRNDIFKFHRTLLDRGINSTIRREQGMTLPPLAASCVLSIWSPMRGEDK